MAWLLALPGSRVWSKLFAHSMTACIAQKWGMVWTVCPWHGCLHCLEVGYYLNGFPMAWLLALPGGRVWSKLFAHGMSACIAQKWVMIWTVCPWHGCLHCLEVVYDLNHFPMAWLLALPVGGIWSEPFTMVKLTACIVYRWWGAAGVGYGQWGCQLSKQSKGEVHNQYLASYILNLRYIFCIDGHLIPC